MHSHVSLSYTHILGALDAEGSGKSQASALGERAIALDKKAIALSEKGLLMMFRFHAPPAHSSSISE